MPYQLAVKSSSFIPIRIRKHSQFIVNSNLKVSSYLDEIDLFTQQFDDEDDLKRSLIREGLLSTKFLGNKIAIRYNDYETLKDSIIYSDLKAYLNKETLEKTLRLLCEDNNFIKSLVTHYMPEDDIEQQKKKEKPYMVKEDVKYKKMPNINCEVLSILKYMADSYNFNADYIKHFILPYKENIPYIRGLDFDSINREGIKIILITIFYYNEVYPRKYISDIENPEYRPDIKDFYNYYVFEKKVKYRNFHDLALFVGSYDFERRKREDKEHQEEFLEPGEMFFDDKYIEPVVIPKAKKRVKKPLEGQMTFL